MLEVIGRTVFGEEQDKHYSEFGIFERLEEVRSWQQPDKTDTKSYLLAMPHTTLLGKQQNPKA